MMDLFATKREIDDIVRVNLVNNLVENLVREVEELRHRALGLAALLDSGKCIEYGSKGNGSVCHPW